MRRAPSCGSSNATVKSPPFPNLSTPILHASRRLTSLFSQSPALTRPPQSPLPDLEPCSSPTSSRLTTIKMVHVSSFLRCPHRRDWSLLTMASAWALSFSLYLRLGFPASYPPTPTSQPVQYGRQLRAVQWRARHRCGLQFTDDGSAARPSRMKLGCAGVWLA